jgi:hypothetical protein
MPVPPITLGELTNVPAPGAEIDAAWAQDLTKMAVHRFANAAARDAAWTWPEGRLAFVDDKKQLSIKEAGGWVVLHEPAQDRTDTWPDGTAIWVNNDTSSGSVTIAGTGTFQRSSGRCYFRSRGVVASQPGSFQPWARLPMDAHQHHDNKFQVDLARPNVGAYFPGYSVVLDARQVQIYLLTDTTPSGISIIGRTAVNSTQPWNWSATGDKAINISGWFQMNDRYSA